MTIQPPSLPSSLELLPLSVRLIGKHFDALIWLIFVPALLGGLGLQLLSNALSPAALDAKTWHEFSVALRAALDTTTGQTGLLILIVSYLWTFITYPATIVLAHHAATDTSVSLGSAFRESWRYFIRIYLTQAAATILVLAGFMAFIVPGFFMLRRYYLAPYEVVHSNAGVFDALARVHHRTKPYKGYVWGLLAITFVIAMASAAVGEVPLVGFVLSSAVTYSYFFAPALRYVGIARLSPIDGKK